MKMAVHLHLYYLNQLSKTLSYLKSLEGFDYDLFVTMVHENKDVEQQLKTFNPNARVFVVENKGYDIGPFIEVLHKIDLDKYDCVLKMHTKSDTKDNRAIALNNYCLSNTIWTSLLWDSLLGSKQQFKKALSVLQNEKVGMVASSLCITKNKKNYDYLLPEINNELKKTGFEPMDKLSFVAGTMFLAKSNVLKPLLNYQLNDFEVTNGKIKDCTFAHVVERLISFFVLQQGFELKGVKSHNHFVIIIYILLRKFVRFMYQDKKTSSGKRIIKICKIPVFCK